ncbi:MAG: cytochrome c biogenesis protein CcsA [bacterium]|nr:cytochrome c biogenesis protein CcsA [Acidimicrobiia bacterium]MCY4648783.1 cytochrome c biogenesis protein CcsA [bacterium]
MKKKVLATLTVLALAAGLAAAFTSPPDALQGDFVRILYIHVPSAWLAFLAFGVTAAGSIGWLFTHRMGWDRTAEASAETGVLFTAVALATGMIWGKPVWGTYWDWGDARLATTALMFFVYLGYLALRRTTSDPYRQARRSSVLGAVAVVQVPLVYFSVKLWRTLHQGLTIRPDGIQMDGAMVTALLVNLGAFTLLYLTLMSFRTELARLEEAVCESEISVQSRVTVPQLGEVEA